MHDTPGLDGYEWPTCPCGRQLRQDELERVACRLCQERADNALRRLPGATGLYASLATVLAPSTGSGSLGHVSGTHNPPLPLRLESLDLSAHGGVVTILQAWLVDWHDHLGWRHPRWEGNLQQQLDQVVKALRVNLEWAATSHPAFGDFLAEISTLVRRCEWQVTGERPERRVHVACPCGTVFPVTVSTPGARCRGCNTQYARAEVLDLPLATRVAA